MVSVWFIAASAAAVMAPLERFASEAQVSPSRTSYSSIRAGLIAARYSLGGAVGLFQSGLGFILILIAYRLADKYAGYRIF